MGKILRLTSFTKTAFLTFRGIYELGWLGLGQFQLRGYGKKNQG